MRVLNNTKTEFVQNFLFVLVRFVLRPYLTSQTDSFYKRIDQSEISAPKTAFVSNPKLYKHDPVFVCVCLLDKQEFSYGS